MTKKIAKFLIASLIAIIVLSALATAGISMAIEPTQRSTSDLTESFVTNVLGLDLTKYVATSSPFDKEFNRTVPQDSSNPRTSNLSETDGINTQTASYYFKNGNGTLHIFCILYNGQLNCIALTPSADNTYAYINSPESDLIKYSDRLLERYGQFLVDNTVCDTAFLSSIRDTIAGMDIKSVSNMTVGNVSFKSTQKGNETRLQWVYTEKNVSMYWKRVEIDFSNNNVVSFQDTWSLYKVAKPSTISAEQAKKIALAAAMSVDIHISTVDGKNETLKVPDLSNVRYDESFDMVPCRSQHTDYVSKLSLDPLTLYPLWQFHFYFNQTVAGDEGIQVGVLGDSSQVLYAGTFGYLGTPKVNPSPTNIVGNDDNSSGNWTIIALIISLALIVAIPIALRRKLSQTK